MRILHINNFSYPDYLNDMAFHGGRSVFGEDYESSSPARYMYQSFEPMKSQLYGKGFSIYAKLPDPANSFANSNEIVQRISDKFYDFIVYGSVYRCLDHFDLVCEKYSRDRIILLDGEDHTGIYTAISDKGVYFKRELIYDVPSVKPVNFAIPAGAFVDAIPAKDRQFATVIPGESHTYKFDRESEYYADYQRSYFGVTMRKAGWDCLRHYEIMANYSLPRFPGLHLCPNRTATLLPKKLISEYYKRFSCRTDVPEYWEYLEQIYNHAKKFCTTEYLIKSLLENL